MRRALGDYGQQIQALLTRLVSPSDKLNEQSQRCDELSLRLDRAISMTLERRYSVFQQLMGKLEALSPLKVLSRGYGLIQEEAGGQIIQSAKQVSKGQRLEVVFSDGKVPVEAL